MWLHTQIHTSIEGAHIVTIALVSLGGAPKKSLASRAQKNTRKSSRHTAGTTFTLLTYITFTDIHWHTGNFTLLRTLPHLRTEHSLAYFQHYKQALTNVEYLTLTCILGALE